MKNELQNFTAFIQKTLVPCANELLSQKYEAYCRGEDIGVETKSDATPASLADRETEEALRNLISGEYPDHGIWGEEYGATNINRDWVWVLDPLDGTKEFLAKNPGSFASLIGLLYKGQSVIGAASDPINKTLWISGNPKPINSTKTLSDSTISCTNPLAMFLEPEEQHFIQSVKTQAKAFKARLNCVGFVNLLDKTVDAAIESRICLHDIAPLIPILKHAGATFIDLEGNDYTSTTFDMSRAATQKYSAIAAANEALAQEILSLYQKREAA
jgi:fructose-1,6-bisphosphatase/inositol monophosphatase family enzyme